jgi:CMP-2-keto-3-deoxyoctulosonic acid synthetase
MTTTMQLGDRVYVTTDSKRVLGTVEHIYDGGAVVLVKWDAVNGRARKGKSACQMVAKLSKV